MPCAELLQANSGSGVLSKLLMSLGSSKGAAPACSREWHFLAQGHKDTTGQWHPAQSQVWEWKQHVDCDSSHQSYSSWTLAAKSDSFSQEKLDFGLWSSPKHMRCSRGPFWPRTLPPCEEITAAAPVTHGQFKPLLCLPVRGFLQELRVPVSRAWSICSEYSWAELLPAGLATVPVISCRKSNNAGWRVAYGTVTIKPSWHS